MDLIALLYTGRMNEWMDGWPSWSSAAVASAALIQIGALSALVPDCWL